MTEFRDRGSELQDTFVGKRRPVPISAVLKTGLRHAKSHQVSGSSLLVGSLFCLQNSQKRKALDTNIGGFVSSTSAIDFLKASSLALACYKHLQGTAGGVGACSSVDRLTPMCPRFGWCGTVEKASPECLEPLLAELRRIEKEGGGRGYPIGLQGF